MNRAMQHRVFALVGEEFVLDLCKPRGFEPIDQPAERHGSWQWTLRKHARELDCFVSMAFTNLPRAVPDSDWYAVKIWAGAEKADRYTRKPVSDFRARGQADYTEQLRSALKEPLLRTMSMAESLTPRDLDEAYRSRSQG